MSLLETVQIECPYCGERIDLVIDRSVGSQEYIEDCQVCCKPINLSIAVGEDGEPIISARHEDE